MTNLINILTESLVLYRIEVLIVTSPEENQVVIYNEIRALPNVVVVNIEQNDFLKSKSNDKYDYALIHIKFLASQEPKSAILDIRKDAFESRKIKGLYKFIPRFKTLEKLGQY